MNQDIDNTEEQEVPDEIQEEPAPVPLKTGMGIVGDSTNNDIVMTKIYAYEDDVIKIKINMIGEEFSQCRAKRLEEQLHNRNLEEAKLVLDYNYHKQKHDNDYPLDVLYESIIRAIDDLEKATPKPPSPQVITKEAEPETSEVPNDAVTKPDDSSSEIQNS